MIIRKMTINDYEQVYALWVNTPGMGLHEIEDSKAGIEKFLTRNPDTCFVAENNENIIGVILGGHNGRKGEINHLAVSQSERNKGIGTDLVNNTIEAFKLEGINRVAIFVFKDNDSGNKFWENKGFVAKNKLIYRIKQI